MTGADLPPLRFTTWLSPGLPLGLFDAVAAHVAAGLGRGYSLSSEPKISGPLAPEDDTFATGTTDVGFLCPPAYLWLSRRTTPSVRLVPMAPVYNDARNNGQPVYLSDVVTRSDASISSFEDLAGRRVGFNEPASLSGYVSVMDRLAKSDMSPDDFAEFRPVGSHHRALELISNGELDAAAIDANVWHRWQSQNPDQAAALHSVDALGPYPVQPVVVRAELGPELANDLAAQLADPAVAEAAKPFGVTGFAPIEHGAYASLGDVVDRALRHAAASC